MNGRCLYKWMVDVYTNELNVFSSKWMEDVYENEWYMFSSKWMTDVYPSFYPNEWWMKNGGLSIGIGGTRLTGWMAFIFSLKLKIKFVKKK